MARDVSHIALLGSFTLPELRVIQDFAVFHIDGCPSDEDGAISRSIQIKVNLMAYAERALLLAKAALQEGHRNVTNSPNPDFDDSAFADALRAVNQALSYGNADPVHEVWLVEQARQRGPQPPPCSVCGGKGANPETGADCVACLGGGEALAR